MQSLSVFYCFFMLKKNTTFKISTCCQPLIIELFWFASLWFRIEEKIHIKTVYDVFRGENFWTLFCLGTNGSLGGRVGIQSARAWRKLWKLTIKWVSSKTVSKDFMCTLHWLFLNTIYWIALQKMHTSEYIYQICLKELAINLEKKLCSL